MKPTMNSSPNIIQISCRRTLLNRFSPEIRSLYNTNPLVHQTLISLYTGSDPYQIIDQLLQQNIELSNQLQQMRLEKCKVDLPYWVAAYCKDLGMQTPPMHNSAIIKESPKENS